MTIQIHILGSSSSGNSTFIATPQTKVLLDIGFSAKKTNDLLSNINQKLEDLHAIFITHEHSDHCKGLSNIPPHIKVFANPLTANAIQEKLSKPISWHYFETGSSFSFQDLHISSFSIPHDAYDPVGYSISCNYASHSHNIAWVTDLGYIPTLVKDRIKNVDTLILESNYDDQMLDNDTTRPWSLKQRIKSRHGHLSNLAAYEFLSQESQPSWKNVFLAHLSRECNCTKKLLSLFHSLNFPLPFNLNIINPFDHNIPVTY